MFPGLTALPKQRVPKPPRGTDATPRQTVPAVAPAPSLDFSEAFIVSAASVHRSVSTQMSLPRLAGAVPRAQSSQEPAEVLTAPKSAGRRAAHSGHDRNTAAGASVVAAARAVIRPRGLVDRSDAVMPSIGLMAVLGSAVDTHTTTALPHSLAPRGASAPTATVSTRVSGFPLRRRLK